MRQHPQACAGAYSPTQRPQAAPHEILYAIAVLFTRACFDVAVFHVLRVGGRSLSSLCRSLFLHGVFVFTRRRGHAPAAAVKIKEKGTKKMKNRSLRKPLALLLCLLVFAAVLSGCEQHVCDYCGKTFTGKAYEGFNGNYELCKDCAEIHDAFFSGFDLN